MKIKDYVDKIAGIRKEQGETEMAINEVKVGHAVNVLQQELEKLDKDAQVIEEYEVRPVAQVIRMAVADITPIQVGNTGTPDIDVTLSNGDLMDPADQVKATVLFVDFDQNANNQGFIKQMTAKDYVGKVDTTLTLTRTSSGYDVFDDLRTQGLMVAALADDPDFNYQVVDKTGTGIGVKFKDDNTAVGDNWRVLLIIEAPLVEITVEDTAIVEANGYSLVAKAVGKTNVTFVGGGTVVTKEVEVTA